MSAFIPQIRSQGPLVGAFLTFGTPYSAQIMAQTSLRFDFVVIDMEHSPLSALEATQIVHATALSSKGRCAPLVRTPSHGVEWMKWALDAGAAGIVVPMVNTDLQVKSILQSALYPPSGQRSFGPFNAPFADLDTDSGVSKYFAKTARNVAVIPMIESTEGLENVERIIGVDGVSGLFVGPVDLRLSLRLQGLEGTEEVWLEALGRIARAGKRHNKPVGIFVPSAEGFEQVVHMGYGFVCCASDATSLVRGASFIVDKCRSVLKSSKI